MAQDPVIEVRDLVVELKGNRVLNGRYARCLSRRDPGLRRSFRRRASPCSHARSSACCLSGWDGISVFGVNLDEAGEAAASGDRARVGAFCFQQGALFSSLTVGENIEFPIREYLDLSERLMTEIAITKLEMVGLKPDVYRKFPSNSPGHDQTRGAWPVHWRSTRKFSFWTSRRRALTRSAPAISTS